MAEASEIRFTTIQRPNSIIFCRGHSADVVKTDKGRNQNLPSEGHANVICILKEIVWSFLMCAVSRSEHRAQKCFDSVAKPVTVLASFVKR